MSDILRARVIVKLIALLKIHKDCTYHHDTQANALDSWTQFRRQLDKQDVDYTDIVGVRGDEFTSRVYDDNGDTAGLAHFTWGKTIWVEEGVEVVMHNIGSYNMIVNTRCSMTSVEGLPELNEPEPTQGWWQRWNKFSGRKKL